MRTLIQSLLAAALALGVFASFARAEDAPKDDGTPKSECIGTESGFKTEGKRIFYEVALENKCEKKLRCQVFVNIMNSHGGANGHRTLVLAAKADGEAAKRSYRIATSEASGMIQVSRECKFAAD